MKKKIAVIGAGISGLSISQLLETRYDITVFEKDSRPGGLIKCDVVDGNLYHMVGGHVFNSKREDVLNWFWNFFDKDNEFTKSIRNAVVFMDKPINYPIENHIYQMSEDFVKRIINDLLTISKSNFSTPDNFEEFLKNRFGNTLYQIYFKPYNEKIWKRKLSEVPISWLEGKLPMPTIEEIILNNFQRLHETNMVHSSFFYPQKNGSQFLANRLAENINIIYNSKIESINLVDNKWCINSTHFFDQIIYTGNIKELPILLKNSPPKLSPYFSKIEKLEYHGTTTALCEIEDNPYSWIYLPDKTISAHRIICTGNFSESNNSKNIKTATIEFTDRVEKDDIIKNLKNIPFSPRYITHKYTQYTYPIQDKNTRTLITNLKSELSPLKFSLLGRFAEWEYYNMDAAIGAAIDLSKKIKQE